MLAKAVWLILIFFWKGGRGVRVKPSRWSRGNRTDSSDLSDLENSL